MKDTQKEPLLKELTEEESVTVNGAHGYSYYPSCSYRKVYHRRPSYRYSYRSHYPTVNIGVTVSY